MMKLKTIALFKNEQCHLIVPSLRKIFVGSSIEEAQSKLQEDYEQFLNKVKDLGMEKTLAPLMNQSSLQTESFSNNFLDLATKGTKIIIVLVFMIGLIGILTQRMIRKELAKIPEKIEQLVNVPLEVQEKRAVALEEKLQKFSPYIKVVKKVFQHEN